MNKRKTGMGKILGLLAVVFAVMLGFFQMAAAEDNFRVCVSAESTTGTTIDYVLYGEPNDAKDGVYDVNGTGSMTGVADIDFLVSGTASTGGGGISLSLNGDTIEGDNQYNLYFNTYMYEQGGPTFGSFITGLIVTDLTNTNPETRYKLQGNAQLVDCE